MSDSSVIANVSQTLVKVLRDAFAADEELKDIFQGENAVSQESPAALLGTGTLPPLSVYLYRVAENASMKNQPASVDDRGIRRPPPLTLDLYYLITPLDATVKNRYLILGTVLQVFYDHSMLQAPELTGKLATEEFRIILNPVSTDEITRIWQAFAKPYQLSVAYTVRVAFIDSKLSEQTRPVLAKEDGYVPQFRN